MSFFLWFPERLNYSPFFDSVACFFFSIFIYVFLLLNWYFFLILHLWKGAFFIFLSMLVNIKTLFVLVLVFFLLFSSCSLSSAAAAAGPPESLGVQSLEGSEVRGHWPAGRDQTTTWDPGGGSEMEVKSSRVWQEVLSASDRKSLPLIHSMDVAWEPIKSEERDPTEEEKMSGRGQRSHNLQEEIEGSISPCGSTPLWHHWSVQSLNCSSLSLPLSLSLSTDVFLTTITPSVPPKLPTTKSPN